MFILFDNGTPAPLRYALKGHTVVEAIERGWDKLANGELLAVAEAAGFDVLLTTDRNMPYQQSLEAAKLRSWWMLHAGGAPLLTYSKRRSRGNGSAFQTRRASQT